jgi:hypothetical protein
MVDLLRVCSTYRNGTSGPEVKSAFANEPTLVPIASHSGDSESLRLIELYRGALESVVPIFEQTTPSSQISNQKINDDFSVC